MSKKQSKQIKTITNRQWLNMQSDHAVSRIIAIFSISIALAAKDQEKFSDIVELFESWLKAKHGELFMYNLGCECHKAEKRSHHKKSGK